MNEKEIIELKHKFKMEEIDNQFDDIELDTQNVIERLNKIEEEIL